MEPIEVTARFDLHGKIYPQQFVWNGRVYPVTSTGRRWQDRAGEHMLQHVLVMTPEAKTYELVFNLQELRWFLNPAATSPKIALST
jgi:hypothetical protein